jgi:hypothetical protein
MQSALVVGTRTWYVAVWHAKMSWIKGSVLWVFGTYHSQHVLCRLWLYLNNTTELEGKFRAFRFLISAVHCRHGTRLRRSAFSRCYTSRICSSFLLFVYKLYPVFEDFSLIKNRRWIKHFVKDVYVSIIAYLPTTSSAFLAKPFSPCILWFFYFLFFLLLLIACIKPTKN